MKYARIKTYHLNGHTALEKDEWGNNAYLNLNSLYPINVWNVNSFEITDDAGDRVFCLVTKCAHLGGGDWEIIEVERMITKSIYKPRFFGYRAIKSIIQIVDGIIGLAISPFGYDCNLYVDFCAWNLKQDIKRRKQNAR